VKLRIVSLVLAAALAACGGKSGPTMAGPQGPGQPAGPQVTQPGDTPAGSPAAAELVTTVEGITEYRLANGMRVLLFPDPSQETVTVNVTYFVGSRHEGYGETGMAHLLEHMVFKGTPTYDDIWALLQDHGASFNGTTWVDRTNYYETLPASDENLEFALRMEADRMVNSKIAEEDLKSEFSVVRNEFEMRENDPVSILTERMFSAAFLWHNYGKSTIGSRSDIERVPIDNLRAFYRKYYQPDNSMLVVAGKFDPDKTLELVNQTFGTIPRPERKLSPTHTVEPVQDGERHVTLRRVGDVAVVGALYHTVPGSHVEFAPTEALVHLLTDEPSGRLYRALVETGLASRVWGATYSWAEPGALQVFAEVATGTSPEKVREALLGVLDALQSGEAPVTDAEVKRYRASTVKDIKLAFTSSQTIAIVLSEFAAMGDWRLLFVYRDRVEEVDTAAVQAVAQKYLKRSNRTTGTFVPTKAPDRAPLVEQPDVLALVDGYKGREAMAAGESFTYTVANIEKRVVRKELPGGLKAAFLAKETRGDAVKANLTLRYGTARSLQGKSIPESMLGDMLMRGTRTLSYQQVKDRLDELEAQVSISTGTGAATVNITTTRDNLTEVLALVADLFKNPAFPKDQFDILRKEQIAQLEQALTDPQQLAFINFLRTLQPYAKGHPRYVPTLEEQIELYKKVKLSEVQRLHKAHLGASHGELAVVGDFDPAEVEAAMAEHFGTWKSPGTYARIEARHFEVAAGSQAIDTPDKEMALVLAGHPLKLRDDDPDYPAVEIINFVLGGSASSRLLERLRQKDGISYGAFSFAQVSPFDPTGMVVAGAILAPQNAEKGMAALLEEYRKLVEQGIPGEELSRAQASYQKDYERDLSNDGYLVGQLAQGLYVGRTLDFQQAVAERIQKLTTAEVQKVLKAYFRPDGLYKLTAADAKKAAGN
jgi:zinc protease